MLVELFDAIVGAVEDAADPVLDGPAQGSSSPESALNSGSRPSRRPTGSGTASSSGELARRRRRRRDQSDPNDGGADPLGTLKGMHDPMLQDNVDEGLDWLYDYKPGRKDAHGRSRRIKEHLADLFGKRSPGPRTPGNPATQLLSEEGAAAQGGAATWLDGLWNGANNLATDDYDLGAYTDRRDAGPFSRKSESAVDRDGDTAWNRFKDRFWNRSSSEDADGGDGGGEGSDPSGSLTESEQRAEDIIADARIKAQIQVTQREMRNERWMPR